MIEDLYKINKFLDGDKAAFQDLITRERQHLPKVHYEDV